MIPEKIDRRLIIPANCANFGNISSEKFQSLLASDKKATLFFFLNNLLLVIKPWPHSRIDTAQVNYTAKFLTRFSTTSGFYSRNEPFFIHFPTFESLVQTCGKLLSEDFGKNLQFLEWTACQILLLGGFYYDDAIKSFDRKEMEKIGCDYFTASAIGNKRKKILGKMAKNFRIWQDYLCYLNWHFAKLREDSLLIKTEKQPEPLIKLTGK